MVLGISSFAFGWSIGVGENTPSNPMSETDLVKFTIEQGLRCLQIGDNLPLHTLSDDQLAFLKVNLENHDIRLEVGARKLTFEHVQRYIQLADFFQSPLLRFVIDGEEYEPDLLAISALLHSFVPELEKRKITLGIENHDRFKAKELASVIKSIDSQYVGICLDCVNSMGAGEGLDYVSEVLAPYTVNLHIKDFKIERLPHKMGFTVTGTHAGKGMLNLPILMEKIAKFDRCQSAVLEQWVPFVNTLEETIYTEKKWADESIAYLKSSNYFTSKF